jgi:hypothetical protein
VSWISVASRCLRLIGIRRKSDIENERLPPDIIDVSGAKLLPALVYVLKSWLARRGQPGVSVTYSIRSSHSRRAQFATVGPWPFASQRVAHQPRHARHPDQPRGYAVASRTFAPDESRHHPDVALDAPEESREHDAPHQGRRGWEGRECGWAAPEAGRGDCEPDEDESDEEQEQQHRRSEVALRAATRRDASLGSVDPIDDDGDARERWGQTQLDSAFIELFTVHNQRPSDSRLVSHFLDTLHHITSIRL